MLRRIWRKFVGISNPFDYYFFNAVKSFIDQSGPGQVAVDVGCGNSPVKKYFRHGTVLSMDIRKGPEVDLISDACEMALKDCSCDLVILTEVLEHVKDPGKCLKETYRGLKEKGNIILSVPFLWGIHDEPDRNRWTETGIRELLAVSGFKVKGLDYKGGCFTAVFLLWKNMPLSILGGNKRSKTAVMLFPFIVLHYIAAVVICPLAIILDKIFTSKTYTAGYVILAEKDR
ncbi:MAG: class I SAM-dependent methyltransferase [Candidatus Omnitrophica bacterium]|nr:class I SAM-dependent methyltransferase [Candidatus Omnitrophota bacterium]